MSRAEADFQGKLIKELEERFPGSLVLKNDSGYKPGIPDLSIFYRDKWAMLECKDSEDAPYRPNQEYYLAVTNGMSYSATIYPQNKEEVLNDLQRSFEAGRMSCNTKC